MLSLMASIPLITLSVGSVPAFAQSPAHVSQRTSASSIASGTPDHTINNWHVVFKRPAITNPKTLYYDAIHHRTLKQAPPFQVHGTWTKAGHTKPVHPPTAYTTQWVGSFTNSSGTTKNEYVTTAFAKGNTTTYDGTGSIAGTGWDSSNGVEAYARIYWNKYTINGDLETKLTKVTGGWHVYDATEYVRNERVSYGADGWTMDKGPYVDQASTGHNPEPSLTFAYTPPSSWVPISMKSTTLKRLFGTVTTATVVRGTDSWGMSLTVEYN